MNSRVAVSCGKPEDAKRYARALEAVGLEPVVLAPPDERSLAEVGVRGLLLSGGTDIDAGLYQQERAPESDEPDRPRDAMEKRLLEEALHQDMPVLAICRGMQMMNVVLRGSLQQHHEHQETHRVRTPEDPSRPAHEVIVRPGTRLAQILGPGACSVNSRHHQAVDRVSPALTVSACAADGIVEGLERDGRSFVVAVQWHPEDQLENDARQRKLFEAFGKAVTESAGGSAR
jgi:putative glutamine amidotransferase